MARLLAILLTILLIKLVQGDEFDNTSDLIDLSDVSIFEDIEKIEDFSEEEVIEKVKNFVEIGPRLTTDHQNIKQFDPLEWEHIWLSKAFTSYYDNFFFKEGTYDTSLSNLHYVDKIQNKAFVMDANIDAFAMKYYPSNIEEVESHYHQISYNKAGAILRMISHIITRPKFFRVMRNFIIDRFYGVSSSTDLFEGLSLAYENTTLPHENFKKALMHWTTTPGYPIINVKRYFKNNAAVITQERFVRGDTGSKKNYDKKYWIPLNYAQNKSDFNDTRVNYWQNPAVISKLIPNLDSNKWVIFNKQQFGFYRVNYDEENWEMIIKTLKSENYTDIHVLNRAQLIDDAFELAAESRLNYTIAFKLISYLKNETDLIPWIAGIHAMTNLHDRLSRTELDMFCMAFISYMTEEIEQRIKYYPSPDDDEITIYTRNILQNLACRMRTDLCTYTGFDILQQWYNDSTRNRLPEYPELLCAGVAHSNDNHEQLGQLINKLTETRNKNLYGPIIACTRESTFTRIDHWNLLSEPSVDLIEGLDAIIKIYSLKNYVKINSILDFIRQNKNKFMDMSLSTYSAVYKSFEKFGSMVTTQEHIDLLKTFSKENQNFLLGTMEGGIAKAQSNVEWFNKHYKILSRCF